MTEAIHHILYTIRRFKTSTALNIAGLLAAFVVCYLMLTQVVFLRGYNHGIKDHMRIYRLESTLFASPDHEWSSAACRFMGEDLAAMPQVEGVTMTHYSWSPFTTKFKQGDNEVDYPCLISNNTAVSNLTDQVLDGSIEWTDTDHEGVIIPASIATQYFGTTNAAGKKMLQISSDTTIEVTVRGVYKDFPKNSTPRNYIMTHLGDLYADTTGNWGFTCLVKFKEGVDDPNSLLEPMLQRFRASAQRLLADKNETEFKEWQHTLETIRFRFQPLDDTYFSRVDNNDLGNRRAMGIIEFIVLLIIIIATINTLNFTLAISPMWVRDTNTRIVLGATRSSIRLRLVGEITIITLVTYLLTLAVCQVIPDSRSLNNLFDGDISLSAHPGIVIAMLAIAAGIGIVSGIYPAYFVTSFKTVTALKSSFGLTPRGIKLRTLLIGLQLVITMFLVSFICTLYQQTKFIFNSDYGFDINRILNVQLKPQEPDYREVLRTDLKQLPEVENVSYSRFIIGSTDRYLSTSVENPKDSTQSIHCYEFQVDDSYFSTMGIKLVRGRDFTPADKLTQHWIVNEALAEYLNSDELPEDAVNEGATTRIIGVCQNIRYSTIRSDKNTPIAFVPSSDNDCWLANVRIAEGADREALKASIARLVKKHSGHESPQVLDMETTLGSSYSNEFRFVKLVYLFSLFCIIIMLVGVFCLTMLETQYRRKEIAIRKVAGATSGSIIGMLCKSYCGLILICFVIATPIAYAISDQWLDTFVEHQSINWWPFPLSLLVVGGLTLGTILLQCWRTAHENPVNSIKDE